MAMKKIKVYPLDNHTELTSGELFRTLLEAGDWTYDQIADVLGINEVKTVKNWGTQDVIPKYYTRDKLIEIIYTFSDNEKIAKEWVRALTLAWMKKRIKKDKIAHYAKIICQTAIQDQRLTRLPALFETDQPLPLATAYVELQLTPSSPIKANPLLLENRPSLREALNKRNDSRYTVRISPKGLIDEATLKSTLILGAPGVGKSSLLRRMALDIAEGKWDSFKVPLFIEARAYWMARKSGSNTDLLSYAVSNMLPVHQNAEMALQQLISQQKKQPIILLVDGLDEIASDSTAVNLIYDELKQLAKSIPWVVTARPSGLMSSLGSAQRCEVIELDDDSIETLIDNWSRASSKQCISLDTEQLKTEILGVSGTREMAKNPFLLTALCYLKSLHPHDTLPVSRIEIYETLLQQIASQAQKRHGNRHILAPNVLVELQQFVFSLYDRPDGVIQIFNRDHWHSFCIKNTNINEDDFNNNILPSRLLSNWMGNESYFHFLHLSLQEHLVARAMLDYSLSDALERRFIPAWRAVFRFYGALLLHHGNRDDFSQLTQTLYKEQDINRLSFLTLANIFADAGIRDTKDWIGDDLREELYISAMSGHDAGPESMYDALALLDSNWLEKSICAEMDEYLDLYEQHLIERQKESNNPWLVTTEDWHDSPYENLAKTQTASARSIIADAFWGENQNRAIIAAHAYASIATPSERQKIIQQASSVSMSDDMAKRIFAFSRGLYRAEFIPFLGKLLDHCSAKANAPFSEALNLVADIGGKEAAKILENLAIREVMRLSEDFNAFEVVINAVARMGGTFAIHIFETLLALPQDFSWKNALYFKKFEADPSQEKNIIAALSDNCFSCTETLEALAGAAVYGRLPSEQITLEINRLIDHDSVNGIFELTSIESARVEAGEPPILSDSLLKIAERHYKLIHNDEDENDLEFLLTNMQLIFDALGKSKWKPSGELIRVILNDKQSNEHLLESVINLAGHVFSGTSEPDILRHLREILFQTDSDYSFTTALAIGRIDLEELFRLQSAEDAMYALEELAAESDLLIFDKFWVDRSGIKTQWKRPPKKILYVYNDDTPEIPQLFSHEMSRYGFCYEIDAPETCVAYFIFDKKCGYWKDVAENLAQTGCPLIHIPKGLTEETARQTAREIGIDFLANYENMQPPSLPTHF